jgi:hypothetical protein
MQITSTIDMTLPFWGVMIVLGYACYYILQMKFEQERQTAQIKVMEQNFVSMEKEFHDLKNIILKTFTKEL